MCYHNGKIGKEYTACVNYCVPSLDRAPFMV